MSLLALNVRSTVQNCIVTFSRSDLQKWIGVRSHVLMTEASNKDSRDRDRDRDRGREGQGERRRESDVALPFPSHTARCGNSGE